MMYKSCIFDLDGTLTDTLDSLTFSVNLTMKEMGLPEITREQCRMFVGNGSRVLLEKALRAASEEAFETSLLRNPQETPIVRISAACPVLISTSESPI